VPRIQANSITINYEQQGSGEPLILIPYLAADHACYAFQVAEYSKSFTCISIDLRGTGASDKPDAAYSTEDLADDVAAVMHEVGIPQAHVSGLSLGAGVGAWLAAKYPDKVLSLSLHAGWTKTDAFLKTVLDGWQLLAQSLNSVPDMVVRGIFPWCFTPELYAAKPDYIESLAAFVRSRPAQPVSAFLHQSNAAATHDVQSRIEQITAPTLITFGRCDVLTSARFAEPMKAKIRNAELVVFEGCAHAPLYERVEEFNATTLAFLRRHAAGALA
jgi:pimeloyl-ACP methyl ester carboxylesterase